MWACLAAHSSHGPAQAALAHFYRAGIHPLRPDSVQAYVWDRLAESNGFRKETKAPTGRIGYIKTKTGWRCCVLEPHREDGAERSKLTADQITEAERLVAEWKPNPAECEEIAVQSAN